MPNFIYRSVEQLHTI